MQKERARKVNGFDLFLPRAFSTFSPSDSFLIRHGPPRQSGRSWGTLWLDPAVPARVARPCSGATAINWNPRWAKYRRSLSASVEFLFSVAQTIHSCGSPLWVSCELRCGVVSSTKLDFTKNDSTIKSGWRNWTQCVYDQSTYIDGYTLGTVVLLEDHREVSINVDMLVTNYGNGKATDQIWDHTRRTGLHGYFNMAISYLDFYCPGQLWQELWN
jgi:hypothetical protein